VGDHLGRFEVIEGLVQHALPTVHDNERPAKELARVGDRIGSPQVILAVPVALVPHACEQGTRVWLYLLTAALLAVAGFGGLRSRRLTVSAPYEADRFVARIGWWISWLTVLLIVLGGALVVWLDPCPP
jgi:hypothetical protein